MLKKEDIEKCHFVPLSSLERVLDMVENYNPEHDPRCRRNLLQLQLEGSSTENNQRQRKWRHKLHAAMSRAIYSHDWDKLLYLLKKSPIWEHESRRLDQLPIYARAMTILLMNHPYAKAQSLLSEYFHMVLSCRSDENKKALFKVLLSLTEKLHGRS
ncbi:PREDICTED: uncharacterized protein LOC106111606 [Papilio polytes]|uniref:uncharacterized protein LOC106111606 n=1 Tax=Papilio polytes TaxID=76194 RepID=UPI000675D090|nr:PREDICTED: uncharacterized protein LOC106111606 [Papilio polytes]